jgi:hypothetical protein
VVYPTVEVRWFYKGALPFSVLRWFHKRTLAAGQGACQGEARRVDRYLVLRETDALGIKLRGEHDLSGSRIEVKRRSRQYGMIRFNAWAAGRVEEWHKWSFVLATRLRGESETDEVYGAGKVRSPWIAVDKRRELCTFRVAYGGNAAVGGQIAGSLPGEAGDVGCDLELGCVRIGDQPWWTLCLEAFGHPDQLYDLLMHTATVVFAPHVPVRVAPPGGLGRSFTLEAEHSYAYPKWISRQCQSSV